MAAVETPALDGLAKDEVRFTQAFTPSPITNTSHASILTGLLPSSHGVTDFAVALSPTHPTWAELLHRQGYHTAAFIGAVILDSKTLAPGLDRGFDFYDNFPQHSHKKSRWGRIERRGMDVVQHAEAWLSAHPTGPHFVWVHLYDPHDPYELSRALLSFYPLPPRENWGWCSATTIIKEDARCAVRGATRSLIGPSPERSSAALGPLPACVLFLSQLSVDVAGTYGHRVTAVEAAPLFAGMAMPPRHRRACPASVQTSGSPGSGLD